MRVHKRLNFYVKNNEMHKHIFWVLLFFSMIIKYSYYGFTYFPVVDDHTMYGLFKLLTVKEVLTGFKMYTTRPVATLLDACIISRLWDYNWVILLFFVLLHFWTCYLIYSVCEKNQLKFGIMATIIFAFFPLGSEASYWIAASSRIVFGIFFACISFFLFMKYIEKNKDFYKYSWVYLLAFAITNLISMGFYEQIIVFSFFGILVLIIINYKKLKYRWIGIIPSMNLLIILMYYKYFSNTGNVANRGQLVKSNFIIHTKQVWKEIIKLFSIKSINMIKNGFINAIQLIFTDKAFTFLALVAILSIALSIIYSREKVSYTWKNSMVKFFCGTILFVIPFAPFFLLENFIIANRNAFVSLVGMGLMFESFVSLIFLKKDFPVLRGLICCIIVFCFILVNISEVYNYKMVYEIDREIVTNIYYIRSNLDQPPGRTVVFNTKSLYFTPTSEHFSNCTGSDWALSGAMYSIIGKTHGMGYYYPVKDGNMIPINIEELKKATLMGMDENRKVNLLMLEQDNDKTFKLITDDGRYFGKLVEQSNNTYIFKR